MRLCVNRCVHCDWLLDDHVISLICSCLQLCCAVPSSAAPPHLCGLSPPVGSTVNSLSVALPTLPAVYTAVINRGTGRVLITGPTYCIYYTYYDNRGGPFIMSLRRIRSVGDLNDENCKLSADFTEIIAKKKRRNKRSDPTKLPIKLPAVNKSVSSSMSCDAPSASGSQEQMLDAVFSSVLSQSNDQPHQQSSSSTQSTVIASADGVAQLKKEMRVLRLAVESLKTSINTTTAAVESRFSALAGELQSQSELQGQQQNETIDIRSQLSTSLPARSAIWQKK